MNHKPKQQADEDLDEALRETFPASDAAAVNESEREAIRPAHRRPAAIDVDLVRRLARGVGVHKR